MNKFLLVFISILLISTSVWAVPSDEDTDKADKGITTEESSQAQYLQAHGRYEQMPEKMRGNIVYEMHEYLGPQGAGYIVFAKRIMQGKVWLKTKHVGPEDRPSVTSWTCTNCTESE